MLLNLLRCFVPEKRVREAKKTHPWLTDEVLALVELKHEAVGTEQELEAAKTCSKGVLEAYKQYVQSVRQELMELPRGSKRWWTKCRELMQQKGKTCSIPALKDSSGEWHTTAASKAEQFAKTFEGKYKLPPPEENGYSTVKELEGDTLADEAERAWNLPSLRAAGDILEKLRPDSATGPDLVPTRFLQQCARELAVPLRKLARVILETGRWPECWLLHWIVPLHKRKATWNAGNYRGVHLTA
jgi:hypothetical protein